MTDPAPRRDPRTERDLRRNWRDAIAATAGVTLRKNPRADRDARRNRIEPRLTPVTTAISAGRATPAAEKPVDLPLVVVSAPRGWIIAVPDLAGGAYTSHDRDVLGAARALADAIGAAVLAVEFADDVTGADLAGADHRIVIAGGSDAYDPERRVAMLESLLTEYEPLHVLLPDTAVGGGDLGRRLAARTGESLAANCWRVGDRGVIRRAAQGRADVSHDLSRILLILPEGAEPVTGVRHAAEPLDPPMVQTNPAIDDLGRVAMDAGDIPLAEAEFILSAGNGVQDWPLYHRLARALNAVEGGSRVAVDDGFLPRARQVGASGTLVRARAYLALGISGAPQHLQGITDCENVLTVNLDPACPMIKRADLAGIGDTGQVMQAMLELLENGEGTA